jgi:hypothetical protein
VFQATQRAQEMAQTGMPEASRMQALQGAQQSAVFGMRAAQDRRGGLMSIGNIQAGMDRTNLAVAAQDAAMRQQNQRFAQQALMTQAQYRDKAFANQWQSWMNKEQQRRALIGAGMQNKLRGLDLAGSIYAMSLAGGDTGTKTTPTTTTYNPSSQFLSGTAPGLNLRTSVNPATMSLYGGFTNQRRNPLSSVGMSSPINQPAANPSMSSMPGFNSAMQDLFTTP